MRPRFGENGESQESCFDHRLWSVQRFEREAQSRFSRNRRSTGVEPAGRNLDVLDFMSLREGPVRYLEGGHPADSTLIPVASPGARAASFARLVAVPAKDGTITAWFKRDSGWLAAAGTNHRCAVGWSRTITGASPTLFALFCLTAWLAALGGRITAFLEKLLIGSGERKILSTIAASELHISGHGCPRRDCTQAIVIFV
jgi:hypothetical protein